MRHPSIARNTSNAVPNVSVPISSMPEKTEAIIEPITKCRCTVDLDFFSTNAVPQEGHLTDSDASARQGDSNG